MSSFIMISRSHHMGENRPKLNWVHQIAVTDRSCQLVSVNGVSIAQTDRNYYYAKNGDQRIHYTKMRAENSSAEFYRDLYVEVYPGLYAYFNICTDVNLTEKLEQAAFYAKQLKEDVIEDWRSGLVFIN